MPRLRGAHGRLMAPRLPRTYGAPWVGAVSRCYAHLRRAHPGLFPPDRHAVVHAPVGRLGLAITSTFGRYDRAGPGHPAGARTIVGRSNLGASPEAIKAVPRLRGAHGRLMAPRLPRTYGAPWVGAVSRCYAHLRRAHPGLFPPDRHAVVHALRGGWVFRHRRARGAWAFCHPSREAAMQ